MAAGPDEEGDAAWQRVAATVRPLKGRRIVSHGRPAAPAASPAKAVQPPAPKARPVRIVPRTPQNTLDGSWDKRLRNGAAAPDATIDLHGFTLAAAHGELEVGLARAVSRGVRVVLLVTGRPPPSGRSRLDDPLRGIIRASVGDWLEHSPHAARIAAIRPAHPRHGGVGALYLVLRRGRT